MDGRVSGPIGAPSAAGAGSHANPPLIGRRDVLDEFGRLLDTVGGTSVLVGLAGEPGAGKTRLLAELAAGAEGRGMLPLWGRAAEFEEEMPFGAVVDALDDHLEEHGLPDGIGEAPASLLATVFPALATVFPALSTAVPGGSADDTDLTGLARYRLYRAVRQLLGELAAESGLVLILDDVHWADDTSVELLDHLLRHPPHGPVLIAVAYRPAQASARLTALVETHDDQITVGPFSEAEVAEFLGPGTSPAQRQRLYEESGGNPFYLEALARMDRGPADRQRHEAGDKDEPGELPTPVRAALQMELNGLSPAALLVAQAGAVAADEFEPAVAAVAAEGTEDTTLTALNELAARDVVRPVASGRFRFRHPIVRSAVYGSAAAGWRLAAHARIASHLADVGAPATRRAHHVERSGRFGDLMAITTLIDAARTVAAQAPATAAHWLQAALQLMPTRHEARLDLLLELATAQAVSGEIAAGRDSAREALQLLPIDDHHRRARAARICAMMERHLGRPYQGRTVLLDELRRIPGTRSAVALPLRLRLVADSLMRGDYRAAQAVLDLMPDNDPDWKPSLPLAIASMRPLPALAAGRIADAVRYLDAAERLEASAPDEHLAEYLDNVAWLCWAEGLMGRHQSARRYLERAIAIARSTGQSYIVPNLLAGHAQSLATLGRLGEAAPVAEEAAELARLLGSRQHLVFALVQQCLVATWSGDDEAALRFADDALEAASRSEEWWGSMARYARSLALINGGRTDEGASAMAAAFGGDERAQLDPTTLLSCCEILAQVEAVRGNAGEATAWADRARRFSHPRLETSVGFARLARAHALSVSEPAAAAEEADQAAAIFDSADLRPDAGRATLRAGIAYAEVGDRDQGRERLRVATEIFTACGMKTLCAQAMREQRRLGVRVPGSRGKGSGPYGLSRREMEVATLVADGYTNQQIAEKLFLSIRTIETHLSHIFTKLGVSSRVGVVGVLTRRS